jgi:hypothetical protein
MYKLAVVYHVCRRILIVSIDLLMASPFLPVFWEQQGIQTFGHRIQITRPQASQPAFDRHFAQLTEVYGPTHCINLLGSKEGESSLTSAFDHHLRGAKGVFGNDVGISHFDFHGVTRVGGHESVVRELRCDFLSKFPEALLIIVHP